MDNFSLVYAICKAALSADPKDGKHQVERLRAALAKEAPDEASKLERLVKELTQPHMRAGGGFQPSRAYSVLDLPGESLNGSAHVPVDRESSAPLAEILAVNSLPEVMPALPIGLQQAAQHIVQEWTHAAALKRLGLEPARTCLIYGPPGTGKTQLGLWLARQLEIPVILVRLDGLMSSLLGTTSRNVGNLFAFANRHRALLLLDEFDSIAKLRDDPNEVGEIKRIVNTLLQELDRRRPLGLTLAITNHPQLLDPAVWRRFEVQLELPVPGLAQRSLILERYLPPIQLAPGQLQLLSWALEGCSGAEIEEVARALKKSIALEADIPFVDRLQQVAVAHGDRLTPGVRTLLGQDRDVLAHELMANWEFSRAKVAEALEVNRSTVSRWLKEEPTSEGPDGKKISDAVRAQPKGTQDGTRNPRGRQTKGLLRRA